MLQPFLEKGVQIQGRVGEISPRGDSFSIDLERSSATRLVIKSSDGEHTITINTSDDGSPTKHFQEHIKGIHKLIGTYDVLGQVKFNVDGYYRSKDRYIRLDAEDCLPFYFDIQQRR